MTYGISALVSAISADVVSDLAEAGAPPLVDGAIWLGDEHIFENSSPPRIVMVPVDGGFRGRDATAMASLANQGAGLRSISVKSTGSGYTAPTVSFSGGGGSGAAALATVVGGAITSILLTASGSGYSTPPVVTISDSTGSGALATSRLMPTSEMQAIAANPPIFTEEVIFECRCWAISGPPESRDTDYDVTQLLYHQLIRSCHKLSKGSFQLVDQGRGRWQNATHIMACGREFVFRLGLSVPIQKYVTPLSYAPAGTTGSATLEFSGAESGDAITIGD